MDINAINVDTVFVDRAPAYELFKALHVANGNDVYAVYDAAMQAVEHTRSGKGPVLMEAETYRWFGHSASDAGAYRSREEVTSWKERDPIEAFRATLFEEKTATLEELDDIRERSIKAIDEAVRFAKEAPYPDESVAFEDNFTD